LRPITPEEEAGIKVHRGEVRGTTALVFPAAKNGSETYTRMMIVWNENRRIKEHRIYAGNLQAPGANGKSVLAVTKVSEFKDFDAGSPETASAQKCYLPQNARLEWRRDQLNLDVVMHEVRLNEFDASRRTALFVEPAIPGHQRVNLAEMNRGKRNDSRTTVRQTLPPPDSRPGVKLGRPTPVTDDTTMTPRGKSTVAKRSDGPTTTPLEELVTAPLAVSPESAASQAANAASSRADAFQIER
jgi:hypothetical protein